MTECPPAFVDLALRLADAAGAAIRPYFRTRLDIDDKADASPVTIADREAERVMRALIEETFPEHGILGEEFGSVRTDAQYVWVLDPIDGTKSFITGKPLFGTLIGLAERGKPILGVIDQPILHERWVGIEGRQTTFNGQPASVRPCAALASAALYATSPHMFVGRDWEAFETLRVAAKLPQYGADCYAYALLASGFCDIVAEASLQPYDWTALVPVVKGAGGVITDWAGAELTTASDGRVVAAGDPRVLGEALGYLKAAL